MVSTTRRRFLGAATTILAGALVAWPAAAAEYEWKWQSYWQPNTVNQKAFERFAENVEQKSGGRIVIETLPVDAIVPQSEILDAIAANILQGSNGGTGYYVGKDPGFALLADFNAGYESPEQLTAWFYEGGGNEIARELYARYGAYFIGPALWGAESIPSKKPLRNVADFEGLKMRAPEGMGAAIWSKLGVGVSTLPGTEVYTALERGNIEATDWGTLGMNDELGYGDIAPYAIYPGIHSMPANDIAINLDIWNGLPDDLKQVLQEAAIELNQDSIQANRELDQGFVAKRDPATLIDWGPEERRELREVAQEVWAEWAEKSEMSRRIYDSHIAYMQKIGLL
jgi:TRAP-type mannitol/chloroaromatic compound transport system substrate-binding protein